MHGQPKVSEALFHIGKHGGFTAQKMIRPCGIEHQTIRTVSTIFIAPSLGASIFGTPILGTPGTPAPRPQHKLIQHSLITGHISVIDRQIGAKRPHIHQPCTSVNTLAARDIIAGMNNRAMRPIPGQHHRLLMINQITLLRGSHPPGDDLPAFYR
ncbi:MAG: hypothetical protein Rhims3KO_11430 [Hyphomicrobiales bacterium]